MDPTTYETSSTRERTKPTPKVLPVMSFGFTGQLCTAKAENKAENNKQRAATLSTERNIHGKHRCQLWYTEHYLEQYFENTKWNRQDVSCLMPWNAKCTQFTIKKTTIANTKRCNSIHARNQEISENKAEHNLGRPTVRHHHNGSPCYDKRYQSTKGIKSHTTKMYTSGEKHHAARVQEASKKKKHKMKKNRRWGEFKAHRA